MSNPILNASAETPLVVVIPAAGVGKRMQSNCPKQYMKINGMTVLEHTIHRLLSVNQIEQVIVAISEGDEYYNDLAIAKHGKVQRVTGGKDRVDSVLAGLKSITENQYKWVLVHDAARPCVDVNDIQSLISTCIQSGHGGLLGYPVRDTMKQICENKVQTTVDRDQMWHALTPQMYPVIDLINAIEQGLFSGVNITDESSAIEAYSMTSLMVEGRSDNIKITRPDDLAYAKFILTTQQELS